MQVLLVDIANPTEYDALINKGEPNMIDQNDDVVIVATPVRGDRVEIMKGRKNPRGTVGVIFWMKYGQAGFYKSGVNPLREYYSIGVRLDDGSVVWDYLHNVKKV